MQSGADYDYATKGASGNGDNTYLQKVRTEGSITITPEMFERMYLGPQTKVSGDLRKVLGNPTPIGLGGFLIAYCPIIFSILGWRGFTNKGEATVGTYFFSGGLLAIISCILEFILGNTFPATFFGVFGAYFLAYGANIVPSFNAYAGYSPNPTGNPAAGENSPEYNSGLAFWNLMMAIFTFYCMICALRINLIFFLTFFFLMLTFIFVSAAQWVIFEPGMTAVGMKLLTAGGATGFVVLIFGWYLLLALMLTTVDFPFDLPVFDLSHIVPSGSDIRNKKGNGDVEKGE
ncbi:related to GPR1 and Fun34p [Lecanosticta acicola]|uniref:Related to GPR1 and Fun34p n=1 Tax=Lecanosticta acicola TaxID=111012 RepID=A0AAI9EAW9_9PEZI|nr:related to GPR1 and Fun34p [Lecanosticta acicola]